MLNRSHPESKKALVLIDVQKGFLDPFWGRRNNPDLEKNISALLTHWRQLKLPVIHVQHLSVLSHSPLRPGQSGSEFMDFSRPLAHERIFTKTVNSAFIGTSLEATLQQENINELLLCGLTSDHCVSTTTRMAANLGFKAWISEGAVATFDRTDFQGNVLMAELIHQTALASLHQEFCTVIPQFEALSRTFTAT
jgi:nicotinamidase-related amidase